MPVQWMRVWGMLAVVLCRVYLWGVAQGQLHEPRRGAAHEWPRGAIHVTHAGQEGKVRVWSGRREPMGAWIIKTRSPCHAGAGGRLDHT